MRRYIYAMFCIVIIILLIGSFVTGAQKLYVSVVSPAPIEMNCNEYLKKKPKGLWLRLRGCIVNLDRVIQVTSSHFGTKEYFAPIGAEDKVALLLKISGDDEEQIKQFFSGSGKSDQSKYDAIARRLYENTLEVVVHIGIDDDKKTRSAIGDMARDMEPDWRILEEGKPAPVWLCLLIMAPGFAFLLLMTTSIVGGFRKNGNIENRTLSRPFQDIVPEGSVFVTVEQISSRFGWLSLIGSVFAFLVLLPLTIMLALAAFKLPTPWILNVLFALLVLLVGGSIFFRLKSEKLALWGSVLAGVMSIPYALLALGGNAQHDDMGWFAAALLIVGSCAWIVTSRWRRVSIPELGLIGVDLLSRKGGKRPGPFASGHYLSVTVYFLLSGALAAAGMAIYVILFGITRLIGILSPIVPNLHVLLGPYLVRPLIVFANQAAHKRRRFASPSALKAQQIDKRAPVVMLRSFDDDGLLAPAGKPVFDFENVSRSSQTFEEAIADQLWDFGPVIAIGRPGETLPESGAAREYVSHEQWKERVDELTTKASVVVLIMGSTSGFAWELENLKTMKGMSKAILVMPPLTNPEVERRWNLLVTIGAISANTMDFASAARVPNALCAVWRNEHLVVVTAKERSTLNYRVAIDLCARSTIEEVK